MSELDEEKGNIDDKVETYSPDESSKLDYTELPKDVIEYEDDFDSIADGDGNIRAELHSETILRTLAERIYNDYNSAIRELYNNEARACRTARDKYGAKPSINIIINSIDRSIVLQGIDSLGITKAVFSQVLRIVGKSGNLSGKEVGQFGMGFISYALLTDMMLLETFARETRQEYAFICDVGMVFRKAPKPSLDTFGTKLTLAIKEDVHLDEIVKTIKSIARFSEVPTKITLVEDVEDKYGDIEYPSGVIDCPQYESLKEFITCNPDSNIQPYLEDRYLEEVEGVDGKKTKQRSLKIKFYKEIHIDEKDYEFFGVVATASNGKGQRENVITTGRSNFAFLLGTPIELNGNSNHFDGVEWALNIKNERDFMPEANRDSLSRTASEDIIERIEKRLVEEFATYNITSIDDYNNSLTKQVYDKDLFWYTIGQKYLDEYTQGIISSLNKHYPMVGNNWGKKLSTLLLENRKIVCLRSLRGDIMSLLDDHFGESIHYIREPDHDKQQYLKEFGVIIGEEYKRDNKLKLTSSKTNGVNLNAPCVVYNSGWWGHNGKASQFGSYEANRTRVGRYRLSTTIKELNENYQGSNIYQLPTKDYEFKPIINMLKGDHYKCDVKFVRAKKGIKCKNIVDKFKQIASKLYWTNEGQVKASKLNKSNYVVLIIDNPSLINGVVVDMKKNPDEYYWEIPKSRNIISVKTNEEYFLLDLYIKYYRKKNITLNEDSDILDHIKSDFNLSFEGYKTGSERVEAESFFEGLEKKFGKDFTNIIISWHNQDTKSTYKNAQDILKDCKIL